MEQTPGGATEDAARSTHPPRTIRRRVGLPAGRAVVGALLVTLAVVGLFTAFRRSREEVGMPYLVVAQTVPAGAVIEADDLAVLTLDLGELADRTFTSVDQVAGAVAIQTLLPGQLLQEANVLAGAPGSTGADTSVEVSFAIDRSRALNGLLTPGEVVDVLATIDSGGESCTVVVAPNARVVAVRGVSEEVLSTSSRDLVITLGIDEDAAILAVVFAVDEADITLARATRSQAAPIEGSFCGPSEMAPATDGADTETATG